MQPTFLRCVNPLPVINRQVIKQGQGWLKLSRTPSSPDDTLVFSNGVQVRLMPSSNKDILDIAIQTPYRLSRHKWPSGEVHQITPEIEMRCEYEVNEYRGDKFYLSVNAPPHVHVVRGEIANTLKSQPLPESGFPDDDRPLRRRSSSTRSFWMRKQHPKDLAKRY